MWLPESYLASQAHVFQISGRSQAHIRPRWVTAHSGPPQPRAKKINRHTPPCMHVDTFLASLFPFHSRPGPRMRRASCMSLTMTVTRFECMVHRFASSNKPTRCASAASCIASRADACHLYSRFVKCSCTSLTSRANGNFRINNSVDRWYLPGCG